MSFVKMLITVVITGLILFVLMMVFALTPTVRNVSDHRELQNFLNKPLRVDRPAYIYLMEEGQYELHRNLLSEELTIAGEKKYELIPGSLIKVKQFKTYKSPVAGFTHLYAIGSFESTSGEQIDFVYDWAGVDEDRELPHAIWQSKRDIQVWFDK